jgi:uncharacterized protein YbjT (DUF2867 family)
MARWVFVAGGTGFLGLRVVRALLDEGAEVTVLVRPDDEPLLGGLRRYVNLVYGDAWNQGSLRGRARGHAAVINLIGGVRPDPTRGLTFRHLNYISARNLAQMAMNDAVPHLLYLSAAAKPLGLAKNYIESKREAERYLQKSGLAWTIVRTPPLYIPRSARNPLYLLLGLLSRLPVVGWPLSPYSAISADTAARAIAQLAMTSNVMGNRLVRPRQLRRVGRQAERRFALLATPELPATPDDYDDEGIFGWLPSAPAQ